MGVFDLPGMPAYVICAVILAAKMFAVAFGTVITRTKVKVCVNPEDTKIIPGEGVEVKDVDEDKVLRFKRAHMNDLENIPLFLILALLFVLTGVASSAAWVYCGIFTLARVGHSIFYIGGIQPWRTASYGLGVVVTLGVMVRILLAVL